MLLAERGLGCGHSASGGGVGNRGRQTVPGLCSAGGMAGVPHNFMLGAFVCGAYAGESAADYCAQNELATPDPNFINLEQQRVLAPTRRTHGLTPYEVEYKIRRIVNDYLQPPKVTQKMLTGQQRLREIAHDLDSLMARDPHELMRAMEVHSILDCALMATAASLFREESRWGLYHYRVDYPDRNDKDWFCHTLLTKNADGSMHSTKRPISPYIVDMPKADTDAYGQLRIPQTAS